MNNLDRMAIAMDAATIDQGTTWTRLCPECKGGSTGEEKLRVTRNDEGVLYICMRASCGIKGFIPFACLRKDRAVIPAPKRYTGASTGLTDIEAKEFVNKYKGINPQVDANMLWLWGLSKDASGYVFRCRDRYRCAQGVVTRSREKRINTYEAKYSFYYPAVNEYDRVIVVEDCISAIACASWGYKSLALLGTHVSQYVLEALVGENVSLFLDPDAMQKSVDYCLRYGWRGIWSDKDPKDCELLGKILGANT